MCLRNTGKYDQYGNPYKQWMVYQDPEAEAREKERIRIQNEAEQRERIRIQKEVEQRERIQAQEKEKVENRNKFLDDTIKNKYKNLTGSSPDFQDYNEKIFQIFGNENSSQDCSILGRNILDSIILVEILPHLTEEEAKGYFSYIQNNFKKINEELWKVKELKNYYKKMKIKKNEAYIKVFDYLKCKVPDDSFWTKTKNSEMIKKALENKTEYMDIKNETVLDKIGKFLFE